MKKIILLAILLSVCLYTFSSNQLYRLQSLYIYNIATLIEWPASYKSGNFVIGLLGEDDIIGELQNIASTKKMLGQNIEIKQFSLVSDISNCHILFIPASQSNAIGAAVAKIKGNSTLVITFAPNALKSGSAINFLNVGNKLAFDLKKANATSKGLKLNPQLDKLANSVQ